MYIYIYIHICGSVRLLSLPFSRKLRVVRKVPLATTRLAIDVQDMYSRVEQGGSDSTHVVQRQFLFVMVSIIERIRWLGVHSGHWGAQGCIYGLAWGLVSQ